MKDIHMAAMTNVHRDSIYHKLEHWIARGMKQLDEYFTPTGEW